MGWNTCQIDCGPWAPDDALVRSTAALLDRAGLSAAGDTHLNLDDAWVQTRYNQVDMHLSKLQNELSSGAGGRYLTQSERYAAKADCEVALQAAKADPRAAARDTERSVRQSILPPARREYAPSAAVRGAVVQVASLESLYKVFERC